MALRITPQTDLTTVVAIGNFSPAMFHPLWFEARKLIGKQEAAEAENVVVHQEITQFRTAKVNVDIQAQRFAVGSALVPDAPRDLMLELFGQHLPGVQVTAFGINRTVHFDAGSSERQHAIGLKLAPREPWGAWGEQMTQEENLPVHRSGMASLTMRRNRTKDEPPGNVNVRIEPSMQAPLLSRGIFMEVNCHYTVPPEVADARDASYFVKALSEQWTAANTCAEEIIDQIMGLAGTPA